MNKKIFNNSIIQIFTLVVILAGCFYIGKMVYIDQEWCRHFFDAIEPVISWPLFVLAYVGLTFIVWFAKDILKIVGALVFGPYISTGLIWLAEMLNILVLFTLARKLGRKFVVEKFHITDKQIERAEQNVKVIQLFFLRSVPLVPFRFLDIGYGLTAIPLRKYLIISAVASPVRIFILQFVLAAVGSDVFNIPVMLEYFQINQTVLQWAAGYMFVSFAGLLIFRKRI